MYDFFLYLYVTIIGFVTAGLCASFSQLVTGQPLSFSIKPSPGLIWGIVGVTARVFAGPIILTRNSIRGVLIENRALYWLVLSLSIATLWSFFSGVVVLETLLDLSAKL